jgi:hypothetical protein
MTAPGRERVGRAVVDIDPEDWSIHPFIASPLVRPINIVDGFLYVLDFGMFEMQETRGVLVAEPKSGRLLRVRL